MLPTVTARAQSGSSVWQQGHPDQARLNPAVATAHTACSTRASLRHASSWLMYHPLLQRQNSTHRALLLLPAAAGGVSSTPPPTGWTWSAWFGP